MTEEQKKKFIEWLDRIVGLTRALRDIRNCNIEGLDEYAGICNSDTRVHLNEECFKYAVETLNPVVTETVVEYRDETFKHLRREFTYRNMVIMTLFDMEEE